MFVLFQSGDYNLWRKKGKRLRKCPKEHGKTSLWWKRQDITRDAASPQSILLATGYSFGVHVLLLSGKIPIPCLPSSMRSITESWSARCVPGSGAGQEEAVDVPHCWAGLAQAEQSGREDVCAAHPLREHGCRPHHFWNKTMKFPHLIYGLSILQATLERRISPR